MIDWFLEKYKTANTKMTNQENEEQEVIIIDNIDNIIQELYKKRKIAITKKRQAY